MTQASQEILMYKNKQDSALMSNPESFKKHSNLKVPQYKLPPR